MQNPIPGKILLSFLLLGATLSGAAQTGSEGYAPYFAAVVVKDVNTAVDWYKAVFRLSVRETMNDANGAYRITILESPGYVLELLELKGSVPRSEPLKGKAAGTELQGHFKIGFKVADMDAWLKHLAAQKVQVAQIWTDPKTKKRNFLVTDPDGNLIQFFE